MISPKQIPETKYPTWQRITTGKQRGRSLHTSTLLDHYIITIGGVFDSDQQEIEPEEISIFNILTYQWQRASITGVKITRCYGHTACLFNESQIILYGGDDERRASKNEVLVITMTQDGGPDEDVYLNIEQIDMKEEDLRRQYHAAEVFRDRMYVFGGIDDRDAISNELWSLDLKDYKWTRCAQKGAIPCARLRHRSALINNKMYVFGGRNNIKPFKLMTNSLFCLDLDTMHWNEVRCTGTVPSPRSGMSFVNHQGSLYLFGGYIEMKDSSNGSNELFCFNLKNQKWNLIQAKNEYPTRRISHSMISYDNGIFVHCGRSQRDVSDLFYLNLLSMRKEKKLHDLQQQRSQLYLNSLYSDVIFLVEGQRIFAHKNILGTSCQYFSNLFSSGMIESTQKEIEVPDCKATTFEALLKHIYCDEVDLTDDLALDLIILSNKWLLKELEEECDDFLAETLTIENVVERALVANQLEASKLTNAIVQFIIEKKAELEKSHDLERIPPVILVKSIYELHKKKEAAEQELQRRSE